MGKKAINQTYSTNDYHVILGYKLTASQEKASNEVLKYVKANNSVIISAVCGAGKTELVYASIEYFLNKGQKVAFAIPRKDVVKEIYERLSKDFKEIKVCCVYGGHNEDINGQLVVLTTHQLYRYENYFDLLILDEADAFPYYKNELLKTFLKKSCKGIIIYLSATIKKDYLKECKNVVYVNKRFHNHPLPEPKIIKYNHFNKLDVLKNCINNFLIKKKQVLIFVPTILIGFSLEKKLEIPFVYSSKENKEKIINDFKNKKFDILITTSILERGITISDIQVIVFECSHPLFDNSTLIQIAGRVGRKYNAPTGEVLFLSSISTIAMKECIKEIKCKNQAIV